MKRSLGSSDSLGALMSVCPSTEVEEHSPGGPQNQQQQQHVYGRELEFHHQSMLDEEGCCLLEEIESGGGGALKKRRLSVEQVKALEKNFEVENKLEPDRKVKLAQELGLQPRQVAVWFQNRRARWKTKQLERDYALLKANYDALNHNYDSLQLENEALLKEIRELKSKLKEENAESNLSVKEENNNNNNNLLSESDEKPTEPREPIDSAGAGSDDMNYETFNINNGGGGGSIFPDFKDGSSDSDSSAILNEDNSPNAAISSSGVIQNHPFSISSTLKFNCASSSIGGCFQFDAVQQKVYQPQFVKMEEHNFFGGDESCNFFSDDQAPTLQWYCPDPWNNNV